MGALLTRLYGVDQTTPYGFKFSGYYVMAPRGRRGHPARHRQFQSELPAVVPSPRPSTCLQNADPHAIDATRSRRLAHSTLQYGMRLGESDARRRFARLKNAVEGSGPITLRLTGPPDLYGPYGDVPPYQMRGIGVMFRGSQAYDEKLRDSSPRAVSPRLELPAHEPRLRLDRLAARHE